MITVITQTTAEREQEIIDLFNLIKPLLDEGMIYSNAIKVLCKNKNMSFNRFQDAWFRDLIAYGESHGYPYHMYSGKKKKRLKSNLDNNLWLL